MARRILVLDDFPGLGGAQRVLLDLAARLDPGEFEVHLAGPAGGRFESEAGRMGLPFTALDLYARKADWYRVRPVLAAAAALRRLVESTGAQLIHANSLWAAQFAGPAGRRLSRPVVVTVHAFPRPRRRAKRWLQRAALARALPSVAAVAAVSNALAEALVAAGVPRRLLRLLANGVDLGLFHPGLDGRPVRSELGLAAGDLLIGLPGRVHPGKGHRVFVEAAVRLAAADPRLHFAVVGEEVPTSLERLDFAAELAGRIEAAGLAGRFRLLGFRSDLPAVLAAMDVVCLPSYEETFGMVLLEAMAAGRPVVASRVGGVPELVEDGVTGRLVPPGDAAALAEAIAALAADPERRRAWGEAGGRTARRAYSIEASVAGLERLYRDALTAGAA